MAKTDRTLVLIDAHALIHRSYHALPELSGSEGEPVGAVYGVASILIKLLKDLRPDYIAAAFDLPHPTFRHIAYEDYKGTRKKTPDDLIKQFSKAREIFKAFNIPTFESPGFEADDIIGTLTEKFKKAGVKTIIASGDLDTLQLVEGKRVQVFTMRKGIKDTIFYDELAVKERYGFKPTLLPDYKGLRGDPSDNIVGIKGIGDKTATLLIQEYGTLEEMYKHIKSKNKRPGWMSERIEKKIIEGEEEAFFSKELGRIRKDVPMEISLEKLKWEFEINKVKKIFERYHFRSLIGRLEENGDRTINEIENKQKTNKEPKTTVLEDSLTSEFEKELSSSESIGILENEEEGYIFPEGGKVWCIKKEKEEYAYKEIVNKSSSGVPIIGYNLKTLFKKLLIFNINIPEKYYDVMIMYWLLKPDIKNPEIEAINTEYSNQPAQNNNIKDVVASLGEISKELIKELKKAEIYNVYSDIESGLIPVLSSMENKGIILKSEILNKISVEIKKKIKKLKGEIYNYAGEEFNINSPKQLSRILFETLNLDSRGLRKTPNKTVSTRGSELEKLKKKNPIISKILNYRELSKLETTYLSTLPELISKDKRIHTTFNQCGTGTGRLSSKDPNLQNIPTKTETGELIREAFVAEKGYEFVSFDYSQIDLRVAAALSGDSKMMEAFKNGEDIHTLTASEINNVSVSEVTKEMRRDAKTVNFGILYGMGQNALSELTGKTKMEAKMYLEEYFHKFLGIAAFVENTKRLAHEKGYVETLYGRRRYFPGIKSGQFRIIREAERMAVNAPVQGTAADIIKIAMVRIFNELDLVRNNGEIRLLLQVHDELLFEVRSEKTLYYSKKIKTLMENFEKIPVPIKVDAKKGNSWAGMVNFVV